jgi:5-oxopent-3-ene-1,2,5-tricarboxylate decarboxylase/2-hydroxyhepta-2,4-diene-1,7-dioate isomerase
MGSIGWRATDVDPNDLTICTWLNGEVRQGSSTSETIFRVEELITHISAVMTLEAGEPRPGERVVVEIEGMGTLANTVVRG